MHCFAAHATHQVQVDRPPAGLHACESTTGRADGMCRPHGRATGTETERDAEAATRSARVVSTRLRRVDQSNHGRAGLSLWGRSSPSRSTAISSCAPCRLNSSTRRPGCLVRTPATLSRTARPAPRPSSRSPRPPGHCQPQLAAERKPSSTVPPPTNGCLVVVLGRVRRMAWAFGGGGWVTVGCRARGGVGDPILLDDAVCGARRVAQGRRAHEGARDAPCDMRV